ncbi:MAG: glycosyltransferase [Paucibacter sp.]|nr:glycosyltransferase [Roseateles sp.]
MRVNILSYEPAGGWILYDYAAKLAQALAPHVREAVVGFSQMSGFDVTLHVNYACLRQVQVAGLHCTLVTHIDSADKLALVQAQAAGGVWGLCMSDDTMRRMNTLTGQPRFVSLPPPAMLTAEHKQLNILVSGRLYPDGRKNDAWSIDFFRRFRPRDLRIRVMGAGWEGQLTELRGLGYAVEHVPAFDRPLYLDWLRASDHLLYTGHDEGALSTIDALLYGVTPIATAQGYHLEQEGPMLLFSTHSQLMRIADRLQSELEETNAMRRRLSDWDGFAARHAELWRSLLAQD